jgi:hypothetical protein
MLERLEKNEGIALPFDQHAAPDGVQADFFGEPAGLSRASPSSRRDRRSSIAGGELARTTAATLRSRRSCRR